MEGKAFSLPLMVPLMMPPSNVTAVIYHCFLVFLSTYPVHPSPTQVSIVP